MVTRIVHLYDRNSERLVRRGPFSHSNWITIDFRIYGIFNEQYWNADRRFTHFFIRRVLLYDERIENRATDKTIFLHDVDCFCPLFSTDRNPHYFYRRNFLLILESFDKMTYSMEFFPPVCHFLLFSLHVVSVCL